MEQEIIVNKATIKTSKNGKTYCLLETNLGKMNVWNPQIQNKFLSGQKYKVLTETENGYTNVLGIQQELGNAPLTPVIEPFKEAREDKTTSMLVSYAKDLVVAGMANAKVDIDVGGSMNVAIEAVVKAYKKTRDLMNEGQLQSA